MKSVLTSLLSLFAIAVSALTMAPGDTSKLDASGKKQGIWKEIIDGSEWYGNYLDDQKSGTWLTYHSGSKPLMVNKVQCWMNGKKNGLYLETDRSGNLTAQRFYINDSLNGNAVDYASGGKPKSEIFYRSGMINGLKKLYNQENYKLQEQGYFVNNLREGSTQWYFLEGSISIEYTYKAGQLEGKMKTYYKNGNIETSGTYKNNDLEGDFFEYYEDGKPKSLGKYLKGKKEGIWKEYDADGKEKKVRYK